MSERISLDDLNTASVDPIFVRTDGHVMLLVRAGFNSAEIDVTAMIEKAAADAVAEHMRKYHGHQL